jgi:hypothetical protein
MKKSFLSIVLFAIIVINSSCKKEKDEFCWILVDQLGNESGQVCNKTETEMQAAYPGTCNYYKTGPKFCWLLDGTTFVEEKTEDYIDRFKQCFGGYTSAVKVTCDYCQQWYTREKHLYKPDGSFVYSSVRSQQYCGDTVQTLFQGREFILRETSDSLITVRFSNNGNF